MTGSSPEPRRDIPLAWVGFDELPIHYANQIIVQYQPEGSFLIGVGQVLTPALIGEPAEMAEQLDHVEFVPIRPLVRVALTEQTMRELAAVLDASIAKADQRKDTLDPRGDDQP